MKQKHAAGLIILGMGVIVSAAVWMMSWYWESAVLWVDSRFPTYIITHLSGVGITFYGYIKRLDCS